jgi:hypothetical protein
VPNRIVKHLDEQKIILHVIISSSSKHSKCTLYKREFILVNIWTLTTELFQYTKTKILMQIRDKTIITEIINYLNRVDQIEKYISHIIVHVSIINITFGVLYTRVMMWLLYTTKDDWK